MVSPDIAIVPLGIPGLSDHLFFPETHGPSVISLPRKEMGLPSQR
jgi:hypothetical protein